MCFPPDFLSHQKWVKLSLTFPTLVSAGLDAFEFAFDPFIPWLLKITFDLLNEARLFNTENWF